MNLLLLLNSWKMNITICLSRDYRISILVKNVMVNDIIWYAKNIFGLRAK
jgi:hypothetical protein